MGSAFGKTERSPEEKAMALSKAEQIVADFPVVVFRYSDQSYPLLSLRWLFSGQTKLMPEFEYVDLFSCNRSIYWWFSFLLFVFAARPTADTASERKSCSHSLVPASRSLNWTRKVCSLRSSHSYSFFSVQFIYEMMLCWYRWFRIWACTDWYLVFFDFHCILALDSKHKLSN